MLRFENDEVRNAPIWVQEIKPVEKNIVLPPSLKYKKHDEKMGNHRRTRSTEELATVATLRESNTLEKMSGKKWKMRTRLRGRARSIEMDEESSDHPRGFGSTTLVKSQLSRAGQEVATSSIYDHYESYQQKISGLNQLAVSLQQSDITKRESAPAMIDLAFRYPSVYTDRMLSNKEKPVYSLKPFHVDLTSKVPHRSIEEIYIGYKTERGSPAVKKSTELLSLPIQNQGTETGARRNSRGEIHGLPNNGQPVRSPRRFGVLTIPKKVQRKPYGLATMKKLKSNKSSSVDSSTFPKPKIQIQDTFKSKSSRLEPLMTDTRPKESLAGSTAKPLRINLSATKKLSIGPHRHHHMITFREYIKQTGENTINIEPTNGGDVSPYFRGPDRRRTLARQNKPVHDFESETTFEEMMNASAVKKQTPSESPAPSSFISNLIIENQLDKKLKIDDTLSPLGKKLSLVHTYLNELNKGTLGLPGAVRYGRARKKKEETLERSVYLGILSELMNPRFTPNSLEEEVALRDTLKRLRGDNTEYSPSIFRGSPTKVRHEGDWELGDGLSNKVTLLKHKMKYDFAALYKSVAGLKFDKKEEEKEQSREAKDGDDGDGDEGGFGAASALFQHQGQNVSQGSSETELSRIMDASSQINLSTDS